MIGFIIVLVFIVVLLISICIYIKVDTKRIQREINEIIELEKKNKKVEKILKVIKDRDTVENVKEKPKRKNYTTKKGEGYMSKYHNKLESLYKTLGTQYKLSIKEGKKGTILLVVEDSENKCYEVKFNSRKFNETSNTIIIAKIKKAIRGE